MLHWDTRSRVSSVDIGKHFQMKFELQKFGNDTAENGSSKVSESVKYLPSTYPPKSSIKVGWRPYSRKPDEKSGAQQSPIL